MENRQTAEGGLWAIVLAAGQGRRLQAMTNRGGEAVPKQFCSVHGDISMLRLALQRAVRFVPETHLRVVVAAEHRKWWEKELEDLPPPSVIAQPHDRGTAAGVLLPLTKVLRHDPEAVVVLLPADHYVEREWVLQAAIYQGVTIVRADPARMVLLGVTPREEDDEEFGWIVPSRGYLPFGPASVEQFREKPGAVEAASLRAQGAFVNSFVLVARASTLRATYEELLPQVAAPFRRWRGGWSGLKKLYELIPSHDLSKDLLEPAVGRLWVVPVSPCGWSDLGTPERVARCLRSNQRPSSVASALLPPRPGFVAPLNLSRSLVAAGEGPGGRTRLARSGP